MTRAIRILAAAAVLALAAPALAHPCDDDVAPAPRTTAGRWDDRGPGAYRYAPRYDARARELHALRIAYRALDDERADFYDRWAGHPGKVRRFERYYAAERARLDARWAELTGTYVARY